VAKFYKNIEDSRYSNKIYDFENIGAKLLLYHWATPALLRFSYRQSFGSASIL